MNEKNEKNRTYILLFTVMYRCEIVIFWPKRTCKLKILQSIKYHVGLDCQWTLIVIAYGYIRITLRIQNTAELGFKYVCLCSMNGSYLQKWALFGRLWRFSDFCFLGGLGLVGWDKIILGHLKISTSHLPSLWNAVWHFPTRQAQKISGISADL